VNNRETCATFSIDANKIKDFESKLNAVKWDFNESNINVTYNTYNNFSNAFINLYGECFPVVTK